VIDPHIPEGQWQDATSIEAAAAKLNAAARKGARYGIRVGYHNHAWELESRIDGRSALEYFASLLDPLVVLEVDTYWAAVGGEDPADLLTRLGDHVAAIHVKDGPVTKDTKAQLPAGQGKIDIPSVLGAAPALEVAVIEFDDYAGDVFDGIAKSLNYLKTNCSFLFGLPSTHPATQVARSTRRCTCPLTNSTR
jgi:sugar phosphate isomerase/epimerase